jgi:hypothetical protein
MDIYDGGIWAVRRQIAIVAALTQNAAAEPDSAVDMVERRPEGLLIGCQH